MADELIAIGEALIDFIPQEIGCEFDEVQNFSPKCGGAPANVCGAYAVLGGKSKIITQLGNDPFGHKIIKELKQYNVDVSCINLTDKANTALAFVSLAEDGNRTFSFYRKPSADMLFKSEDIKLEWFENAYALHFCSVSLGDFPMRSAHKKAIDYAREKAAWISFDPNLRFQLWDNHEELYKTIWDFIPLSDIVKISDEEIEFICKEKDVKKAVSKLFCGNVKLVIYTCGKSGAYVFTKDTEIYSPCEKVKTLDTTGAGDGFIGSFLYAMNKLNITKENFDKVNHETIKKCLDFANCFCTESVKHKGAIESYRKITLNK